MTAPYFSDDDDLGLDSLEAAVAVYNGVPYRYENQHLHPDLREMEIDGPDIVAIAAFLRSLTDPRVVEREAPYDGPSLHLPQADGTRPNGTTRPADLSCVQYSPLRDPGDRGGCP